MILINCLQTTIKYIKRLESLSQRKNKYNFNKPRREDTIILENIFN